MPETDLPEIQSSTSVPTISAVPIDLGLISVISLIVLMLTGAISALFYYYKKKKHNNIPPVAGEANNLSESVESDTNADSDSILPGWLIQHQEMIYPRKSVERGSPLGHGQYGAVFKGKLTQGKAV